MLLFCKRTGFIRFCKELGESLLNIFAASGINI